MGRKKATAGLHATSFNKGKRARTSTPSPDPPQQNIFREPGHQKRYEEIQDWTFITERKVHLFQGECDQFLDGLMRRRWHKLADPLPKFDPQVVLEFYANAWPTQKGSHQRRAKVRGKWVSYDREAISQFLDNPLHLEEGATCSYRYLCSIIGGFGDHEVEQAICIPGRHWQTGPSGNTLRILRKNMKSYVQVWLSFLLANIVPLGHVSDLNAPRCYLLFCILKDNYTVDVASIISDEMYRFATYELAKRSERAKGSLGFPALITALCAAQGIEVNPTAKLRPAIDKKFIDTNCTNPDEHPQPDQPEHQQEPIHHEFPHQPQAPPQSFHSEIPMDHMTYLRTTLEHIQLQQSATHRGMTHIYERLYKSAPAAPEDPWWTPDEFRSYVAWPGDRPNFPGGAGASRAGPSGQEAEEHAGAAEEEEDDFDTQLDRDLRGD